MALQPCTKSCDFKGGDLYKTVGTQQFSNVLSFLENHGGLDTVEEYGRTALMELVIQRHKMMASDLTLTSGFENTFAQNLIDLGCDINKRDRYGYTALRYAMENKNYEMVEFLLQCSGVEFKSLSLPLDDIVGALFVKAGYDIFIANPKKLPIGTLDTYLEWHQGQYTSFGGYNCWKNFEKTLTAVKELYPDRLPQVPPFYLDTVTYDFLMEEFATHDSRHYASKRGLAAFIGQLQHGLSSTDECGRNLLFCCLLLYMRYHRDKRLQSYAKKAVRSALNLIDMGISLTQPDFKGQTPIDYLEEIQLEEVLIYLQQKQTALK